MPTLLPRALPSSSTRRFAGRSVGPAMATGLLCLLLSLAFAPTMAAEALAPLAVAPVQKAGSGSVYRADGMVEAVRRSLVSAQVAGRITALPVKAGDRVKAGQLLVRIDETAAAQQAAASQAQASAAQAQMALATQEFERSKRLYQQKFLSQAALDQAEAKFKAGSAEARASLAQAGAARSQTAFHTLSAPYAGIVAMVAAELGDMAMPGKLLVDMYDPTALRVVADLPESMVARIRPGAAVSIELPAAAAGQQRLSASAMTILPTANPGSHTVQVRLSLPATPGLAPGLFARALLPLDADAGAGRLTVPLAAVIKRSELNAVYVVDAKGRPQLRQVRLGQRSNDRVEVLAGLNGDEQVALDPLAAARRP